MEKREATVNSSTGLHARPGSDLVELAMSFKSDIILEIEDKKVNSKEVLEVLTAGIGHGAKVTIIAEGEDEVEAADKIAELINTQE